MNQYTIENGTAGTFLVYRLGQEDELDTFSLGMVANNRISGILPVSFTQGKTDKYFRFNITSKISLRQFIKGGISRTQFVKILTSMGRLFQACEEYMLELSALLLDLDYLYINVTTLEISAICIPIIHPEVARLPELFLKGFISEVIYAEEEDLGYPARILNRINRSDPFSPADLLIDLNRLQQVEEEPERSSAPPKAVQVQQKSKARSFFGLFRRKTEPEPWSARTLPDKSKILDFGETCTLTDEAKNGGTTLLSGANSVDAKKRAYLLRVKTEERVLIDQRYFRIGSERTYAHFCIEDNPAISRSHADINEREGRYFIVDNNSTNHTYLDGEQLLSGQEYPIDPKSEILLADERIKLQIV